MKVRATDEIEQFAKRYDYLAGITREGWAWEHLRRHSEFASEAYSQQDGVSRVDGCFGIKLLKLRRPVPEAAKWGLVYFPHPDQRAIDADVFWAPDEFPRPVEMMVRPRVEGEIDEIFEDTVRVCRVLHLIDADGANAARFRSAATVFPCCLQNR